MASRTKLAQAMAFFWAIVFALDYPYKNHACSSLAALSGWHYKGLHAAVPVREDERLLKTHRTVTDVSTTTEGRKPPIGMETAPAGSWLVGHVRLERGRLGHAFRRRWPHGSGFRTTLDFILPQKTRGKRARLGRQAHGTALGRAKSRTRYEQSLRKATCVGNGAVRFGILTAVLSKKGRKYSIKR